MDFLRDQGNDDFLAALEFEFKFALILTLSPGEREQPTRVFVFSLDQPTNLAARGALDGSQPKLILCVYNAG